MYRYPIALFCALTLLLAACSEGSDPKQASVDSYDLITIKGIEFI